MSLALFHSSTPQIRRRNAANSSRQARTRLSTVKRVLAEEKVGSVRDSLAPFPPGPAAVIFDLDGTLTETELWKARSYAFAAAKVYGVDASSALMDAKTQHESVVKTVLASFDYHDGAWSSLDEAVATRKAQELGNATTSDGVRFTAEEITQLCIQAYMDNIGGTTEQVARQVVNLLGLHAALAPDMERLGVEEPWQALYKMHKEGWPAFCTEENIWEARYPQNLTLVDRAAASGLPLAVATSSLTADAENVVTFLRRREKFRHIIGKDQVKKPKPNPEIYLLACSRLGVPPERCVAVEDSVAGGTAAAKAGLNVCVTANVFTAPMWLNQEPGLIPPQQIAYTPELLESALQQACAHAASK